ncbi:MAG: hypothetical protein QOJ07_2653, partial [Thermoleophilaceae bacterium]|nr:hypothetical protein [Thermoleophilaceae bacterium]
MVAPGLATTAAPTEIRLCGRFAVCVEGERVDSALPARQGRLLLAYLLLNRRRPVPRDELVAALWPGDQPAGDLAPPLSRLRKALGPGRLEGRNDLALVLPDDAWIDWEAAHADLASVRAAVQSGDHAAVLEPAGRVALTAEAGLLPGLDAQWIDERRRELADMRVEALEAAAVAGTALGGARLPAAERAARQAVEAAPFHESAYAALMEVLRARGNVAEGLRAYEDLRVLLREELGTVPGPRVTALHERLLRAESEPEPERAPVRAPVAAGAGRPSRPRHEIVERDRELAELVRLADAAEAGSGRVALIEGPAGIGKSRLLTELRLHAESRGTPVLTAHGSVLEREFPFGLVRQLFEGRLAEPGARERLLSGAAAAAAPVFGAPAEAEDNQGDAARFASLNGLMWLTLNLAADGPLVLALDDLQWADVPSLRFVAYLARRLEGAPLLVAATLRSREEPTEPALVAEIAQAAAAAPIHPRPLTGPAVEAIVAERLGADPDPAFAAACHRATGGNPLLLQELLTALRADGVAPESASVELVRDIGPRAVSRGVLLRLARLPDDAIAVARAIAVLGENAAVPAIADLADIDETAVAAASDALTRAEILREEAPIAFAHPLLQDVVYRELAPAARELAHRRAARALGRLGASAEQISSHLLATSPRADEWSAETLREAGATARRRGAPESAIAYLRRALDETPAGDLRPWLLLELGVVEAELDAASAAGHLRAAREGLPDPRARSMAAFRWGYIETVAGDSDAAAALVRTAAAELDGSADPALVDLRQRLTALELYSCWFGVSDSTVQDRLAAHDYGREDDSAGGQMLLAVEAFNRACR